MAVFGPEVDWQVRESDNAVTVLPNVCVVKRSFLPCQVVQGGRIQLPVLTKAAACQLAIGHSLSLCVLYFTRICFAWRA